MLISLSNLARNQLSGREKEAGVDFRDVKVSRNIFSLLYCPVQLSPFVGVVTESLYFATLVVKILQSCAALRSHQSSLFHTDITRGSLSFHRFDLNMRLSAVYLSLLLATLAYAKPEGSWKWGSSSDSTTTAAPASDDKATAATTATVDVESAADAILHSTRTGKVINTYEAVYEDQHVQEALQKGNDTEARTYIKEKLCNLGLAKECAKLYSKSYGFGPQVGIDPGAVSYVQPVAIVPAGAPIPAVPLGVGVGPGVGIGKHHGKGHAKSPAKGYGAPPLSTGYGVPPVGLNSLSPPPLPPVALPPTLPAAPLAAPLPAALPPAPLQHIHHHYHEGNKLVAPPPPPPIPTYNAPLPPPPPIQPLRPTGYSNPPPPPPRQPYASNPVPSYASNSYADYSPRDSCVCVPIEQCPSADRIGRVSDYAIDPRTKSKSNATVIETDDDIVILNQPETRATSARRRRQSIHHRQTIIGDSDSITVVSSDATPGSNPINPPIVGGVGGGVPVSDDSDSIVVEAADAVSSPGITDVGAPASVSSPGVVGSPAVAATDFFKTDFNANEQDHESHSKIRDDDPWKLPSATSNSLRPLRQASYEGPRGEQGLAGVAQAEQRSGYASAAEPTATFKHGYGYKAFEKAFGKGIYNFPVPVATPVAVPQPVSVPVPVPQPVPVAQPYAVPQPVPVKVPVVEHVPVRVPVVQHVPVQVPVHVPVRVEVPVKVEVPVPVAAPYPVPVPYEQPVQVHEHYHHSLPPKASVYRPPVATYGTPVPNYAGPVSPYAPALTSTYGAPPLGYQGAAATGYGYGHQGAAATGYGYGHQAAAAYDSVTVQAAHPGGYTFRDSASSASTSGERRPKAVGSGVRFVDSRSGEAAPTSSTSSSTSSSSVRFETAKRKRSPKPQESYAPQQEKNSESVSVDEARDARQLGNSFPTCSYNQVCCRSAATNRYTGGAAPGTCGRRNPQGITGRIKSLPYADGEAEFAEYPWQAAILKKDQYDNVYVCGGALVAPNHILTAAHCIKGLSPAELRVRLGEWDVNRESEFYPHVEKDVVSVIIHPEYYPGNLYNDIALIKLDSPVDFAYNPHIAPACLPQRYQEFVGSRCWVTGWGKDNFGTGGRYQNILKEVDVPVVDNVNCENKLRRTRLGYDFKLHQGFLCAGGEEGKDACKGDGGGPLVCEQNGSWYLAGLVSWGIGCGSPDVPGVYVKVSEYSDWVQKNLVF